MSSYLVTDYFAPAYFRAIGPTVEVAAPVQPITTSDADVIQQVVARLAASGGFARVLVVPEGRRAVTTARDFPLAIVTPMCWSEAPDVTPGTILRTLSVRVALRIREVQPVEVVEQIGRLSTVAESSLRRNDLAGLVVADLSRVQCGAAHSRTRYPESEMSLDCTFAYRIQRGAG